MLERERYIYIYSDAHPYPPRAENLNRSFHFAEVVHHCMREGFSLGPAPAAEAREPGWVTALKGPIVGEIR